MRVLLIAGLVVGFAATPCRALDATATSMFEEAVRLDLSGDQAAPQAFEFYRRAAEKGLPAAQFNVAVMLDSGRGVVRDVGQAAVWYARAGAHGHQRAAYNLGQLYANGQGVPENLALAHAWFAASNLPAARDRLAGLAKHDPFGLDVAAPTCLSPAEQSRLEPATDGIEIVWTLAQQRQAVRFFVELRRVGPSTPGEVFSGFSDLSSIVAKLPEEPGDYAWRVTTVVPSAGHYLASPWSHFSVPAATCMTSTGCSLAGQGG